MPSVVPSQEPLVWVSGQTASVSPARVIVVEDGGSRAIVHRLAEGTTKFFSLHEGKFESIPEDDALLVHRGTAVCAETLLDGRRLVGLRVFFGAACGPRS
jgi:hypothetical protein